MSPACIVYTWPPLLWQGDSTPQWEFVHMRTEVLPRRGAAPCTGQTVWANTLPEGPAGVAWEWIQLQPGVVAMADPMGLISNLCWVNSRGEALPSIQQALHLNEIVHRLPWQSTVAEALQSRPTPTPTRPQLAARRA